jgi:hypothetical protein
MSMEIAVNAALHGPEKKRLKVYDHEFNVKPAELSRRGARLTISGQISHHLTARRDDQVYYTIILENAVIQDIKKEIERGGVTPLAAPIVSVLAAYYGGIAVPPDQVATVGRALGKFYDGGWESAASIMITNIGLAVSAEESKQLLPTSSGIPDDGTLLKEPLNPAVYIVYGGAKFHIPSEEEFVALGFSWGGIRVVPDGELLRIPDVPHDGTLLKERSRPEVYVMRGSRKSHIPNEQRFEELGLAWGDIRVVPDGALARLSDGPST